MQWRLHLKQLQCDETQLADLLSWSLIEFSSDLCAKKKGTWMICGHIRYPVAHPIKLEIELLQEEDFLFQSLDFLDTYITDFSACATIRSGNPHHPLIKSRPETENQLWQSVSECRPHWLIFQTYGGEHHGVSWSFSPGWKWKISGIRTVWSPAGRRTRTKSASMKVCRGSGGAEKNWIKAK